ncbi:GcrA family cell cycle regulator [Loktanella salsilacus]|jgi:GcrA cell cycle regulator|uniref:GcrA cell cycle regulator n=1 Tax=Loktanella salsilacus TaxID=195913 RepID=A0A1I4H0M7_9RHOB|nr:GcrA family cell cycle regulator [Loktanella salsilacus]MBU0779356.1 GcrA cell cycle regulator [Alphaproteobacteria bacterium]MBU1836140.1 GcrA cell cycle regulator [Alphaproteobacteria bacterium]UTH43636.1 GcrA cell cycle regulator [Loktanella salsilacus]UTH47350.1 GcrA cell cycle regulator [Loktanella salsilacus]SFL35735.1 GcrA cell cycle regulator [Loktanella salsilacus]|tara:strand:- start:283 stop:915 length:633 start_codon:yes stop_codon:yes gene_type:complete
MSWTDERVETLKRMWGEGQSASQIAKELGGVTRNAVIGKVHRLGLSNRAGAASAEPATAVVPATEVAPAVIDKPVSAFEDKPHMRTESATPARKPKPDPDAVEVEELDENGIPISAARRAIIPAGQPLPPQPSANEISPEALAKVNEVEKTAKRIGLMELTEKTCKWPVGDPATPDFWFCGLPSQQGKPYCEAHVGVAFQPMSSRRDRRR